MSFLVVFNADGAAVSSDQLKRIDPGITARHVRILGRGKNVAFVESEPDADVMSGDAFHAVALDKCWLIGRVRLDGCKELGQVVSNTDKQDSDPLLFLRAYARWGESCLDHLRGDFCFALWDEDRQHLFCGRDQLGVKPLFHAVTRTIVLVSDSIESIAAERAVSNELDDYWIADFLTFGTCIDLDRTVYKHVRRLPPGHCLTVSRSKFVLRRYWQLTVDTLLYYRHPRQYTDHFNEILKCAIDDRLPSGHVGISMSGGLDSSTLAAQTLSIVGDPTKVIAHTGYFEHLIPDDEKHFASLVANKLGIPLTLRALDDACYDPIWYTRGLRTPEPSANIVRDAPNRALAAEMLNQTQTWFYGEGPDNALVFEWQAYLRWLIKTGDWKHLGSAIVQYAIGKSAREWRSTLQTYARRLSTRHANSHFAVPPWLNEGFVREMDLGTRINQHNNPNSNVHPWHPKAIASLTNSLWTYLFDSLDTGPLGSPLTWRHPYLDLRILTFLLSVPPIPWARRKRLIRKAMQGILPSDVLRRDKTPLARDPEAIMLDKYGLPPVQLTGRILDYVDPTKVPSTLPTEPVINPILNVYVLDAWLQTWRCKT